MNLEEKEDMARFIVDLNEEWGMTVLMIEHDMGVVMDISHRIMVLDFGRKIAEGVPEAVLADQHVRRAYLGEADELVRDEGEPAKRHEDSPDAQATPAAPAAPQRDGAWRRHCHAREGFGIWRSLHWSDCADPRAWLLRSHAIGVARGDVIGLIGDNRPDWVMGEIAACASAP